MAVGLQRSGDWLAARRCDQCATLPANHRCAVGVLPLLREEFGLLSGTVLVETLNPAQSNPIQYPHQTFTGDVMNFGPHTMRQSFRAIGRRSSENGGRKKEKHHQHFIRPPVTPYGRPKYRHTKTYIKSIKLHIQTVNKKATQPCEKYLSYDKFSSHFSSFRKLFFSCLSTHRCLPLTDSDDFHTIQTS